MLDIDKLIRSTVFINGIPGFSSMLDIDKLIHNGYSLQLDSSFSSMLDIDKLIHTDVLLVTAPVLVLCWILIN